MQFEEKQRLNLWWLYVLIGIETIVIACVMFIGKNALTNKELQESHYMPLLASALPLLVMLLIHNLKFKYSISENGINYQSIFFWSKTIHLNWNSINRAYIRQYDALSEYGGWGIKRKLWFKLRDKAYIFNNSNKGLQLELNNNKKLLFSITNPNELEIFLINLKTKYQIQAIESNG